MFSCACGNICSVVHVAINVQLCTSQMCMWQYMFSCARHSCACHSICSVGHVTVFVQMCMPQNLHNACDSICLVVHVPVSVQRCLWHGVSSAVYIAVYVQLWNVTVSVQMCMSKSQFGCACASICSAVKCHNICMARCACVTVCICSAVKCHSICMARCACVTVCICSAVYVTLSENAITSFLI